MKCFYSGSEAIGVCKSCGRGLALDFATEFPQGLACKNRCEADVQQWIKLATLDHTLSAVSFSLLRSQNNNAIVSGAFCILAGGGFIYFTGFYGGLSLPSFMGAAFAIYGTVALVRALQARRKL